jgi:hypothetical protein
MTPKTNWTSDDYINADDFNRIENNILEVFNFIKSIGYYIDTFTVVTNRGYQSFDYISSINRIESNLEKVKAGFVSPPGYRPSKVWAIGQGFTFDDANRLEINTQLLMDTAVSAKKSFKYAGTINCGEGGLV